MTTKEEVVLNLHSAEKIGNAPFVGQININASRYSESAKKSTSDVHTIVLLDRSGSMGQNVSRFVQRYLPMALILLFSIVRDNTSSDAFDYKFVRVVLSWSVKFYRHSSHI